MKPPNPHDDDDAHPDSWKAAKAKAWREGYAAGAAAERSAIVAWLNTRAASWRRSYAITLHGAPRAAGELVAGLLGEVATDIESGKHREEE